MEAVSPGPLKVGDIVNWRGSRSVVKDASVDSSGKRMLLLGCPEDHPLHEWSESLGVQGEWWPEERVHRWTDQDVDPYEKATFSKVWQDLTPEEKERRADRARDYLDRKARGEVGDEEEAEDANHRTGIRPGERLRSLFSKFVAFLVLSIFFLAGVGVIVFGLVVLVKLFLLNVIYLIVVVGIIVGGALLAAILSWAFNVLER